MIGYQTHRRRLRMAAGETLTLAVQLDSTVLKGPEIKVEEERIEDRSLQITPPTFKVQQRELKLMPGTLDDILPVLHTLPGVLPLSDYSTQFIVHGGSPNQNLILVDGIELINPYRRSGMASLFNPALVQDVNLYTGGFPVLFGDRLSSVLAVTTRDGTTTKWLAGKISASTSTANLVFEGKTNFWNGGWLLSGRRSYFDLFDKSYAQRLGIANKIAFPNFEDLHGKLVLRPTPQHRLQLNAIHSRNVMDYLIKEELGEQDAERDRLDGDDRMQNVIFGAAWSYTPSTRWQAKAQANWYRNYGNSSFVANLVPTDVRVPIIEDVFGPLPPTFGVVDTVSFAYQQRYDFRKYSAGGGIIYERGRHAVEFGGGFDRLKNSLAADLELNDFGEVVFAALTDAPLWFGALDDSLNLAPGYSRWHVYAQDKLALHGERVFIQPGLRYDNYGIVGKGYLSPRLNVIFAPHPRTIWRAAWGVYRQSPGYEKLLDGGQIFELLRFQSLDELLAEKGTHLLANFSYTLGEKWQLTVEAYRKDLEGLIVQASAPAPRLVGLYLGGAPAKPNVYSVQQRTVFQSTSTPVNDAQVKARGIDLRLAKKAAHSSDRWEGWLSYSFGRVTQEQNFNGERRSFFFQYDRRHAVNLVLNSRLVSRLSLGVKWLYGSGFPYTPAISVEPLVGVARDANDPQLTRGIILTDPQTGFARFAPKFGGAENLNSRRLPDYHRLDIRLSYSLPWREAAWEFYLDFVNLYNRKNVFYYRNIIKIEDEFASFPPSLQFPKPVLYREPVYMLPFIPSFGFSLAF